MWCLFFVDFRIDTEDENNDTALHIACRHGYMDVAHALVNSGADLSKKNAKGELPFSMVKIACMCVV